MKTYLNSPNKLHVFSLFACIGLACAQLPAASAAEGQGSKAFGFAAKLSPDTEAVFALRNLAKFADGIGKSNTWERVSGLIMEASGLDVNEASEPFNEVMNFVGEDAFIALGKGAEGEISRLMDFYGAYYSIYPKFMELMIQQQFGGDLGEMEAEMTQLIEETLNADDGKVLKSLLKVQVPPLIIGCRPPEGAVDQLVAQLAAFEEDLPPIVLTSEFDVAGAGKFHSWTIAAKDAFDDASREEMRAEIDNEKLAGHIERIIDSKKVEFSFGAVDGCMVLAIGPDHSHLKFAAESGESLIAQKGFKFMHGYADKQLLAYGYAAKELLQALNSLGSMEGWADMVTGALEPAEELGFDVSKVTPLIKKLGKQLAALTKSEADTSAGVIYVEDGLKGASIGGFSTPGLDGGKALKLAGAIPDDAFLAINMAATEKHKANSIDFMETFAQLVYQGAFSFARSDEAPAEMAEILGMVDQEFVPKMLKGWGIMKNKVFKGLGSEAGVVIDLKGSMPKIPIDHPAAAVAVKKGKLPRIAMFNSVNERKLLTEAWEEMVPLLNDIAKGIPGQEPGQEFEVPDPLSSDGKNVKTHFFGLPFVSNDFLPSLSISDEMFFLSTSKNYTEELAAKIAAGDGPKLTGAVMHLRFSPLHAYAVQWLDLVLANSEAFFAGNEFAEEDFKDNSDQIRMALDLIKGIKGLNFHRYKDKRWRSDWHLEITDIEG
ncbi:MAG: hypothetical protein GY899_07330 [Verrucomicrobiaceae bacterium]|nr:hypothetical protein [Verrucomicrobiaceae bacterium]